MTNALSTVKALVVCIGCALFAVVALYIGAWLIGMVFVGILMLVEAMFGIHNGPVPF